MVFFELRGWGNPRPILIQRTDRADLVRMRARIAADIAELLPQCEELDRSLPERMLQHGGYIRSKCSRDYNLTIDPTNPPPLNPCVAIDPWPNIDHQPAGACAMPVTKLLRTAKRVLCVGEVTEPSLREALLGVSKKVNTVTPGEGTTTVTPSGRTRPAADSFSAWLAVQEEADRANVTAVVLTRQAGRDDVELLRHRIYPHQRILVEAGSPALTWILAGWSGVFARWGGTFVFSEPGDHFCEPSDRRRLAPQRDWPRISVVTTSYNQRDYLEQCLLSVLDQRYPHLEYIVVDAGSTDGSVELLRWYQERYNCFAKLILEPDNGQSDGLNKGFGFATGEILTWVNSDDMLAPLSLKRAAMALCATGADLVTGTCRRIRGRKAQLRYKHHCALPALHAQRFYLEGPLNWCDAWEKADYFYQPEVFFTRSIWERAGGYLKSHLYWAMDWDLWLRCALAGAKIVRIPDILASSREHAAQKTTSGRMYLWQIVGILREFDHLLATLEARIPPA